MIFKYGSRVARMTATYANIFTDILKTTAGYHYLCPVLLPSWQNFPYPAAFFISNIYAGFLLFKKKTASELPFLETRTFRLHRNRRIASGDSDVFRAAPAVCIINTVRCLALYFETALRCFKKVAECAAFLLVEAAAAGIAFILRRLSFYQKGIFTASVFRIVHTSGYTTIQFCHEYSLLICFIVGSKVFLPLWYKNRIPINTKKIQSGALICHRQTGFMAKKICRRMIRSRFCIILFHHYISTFII